MKSFKKFYLILILHLLYSVLSAQVLPEYYKALDFGNYTVGFKSICVFDTSRDYDLSCGDSAYLLTNNKLGRPILINIWYPSHKTNQTPLNIRDFFDFPSTENTAAFFKKLKDFQFKNSQEYAVEVNMKKKDLNWIYDTSYNARQKLKTEIFNNYINSTTISYRNASPIEGDFPIIIYHQGLGGTIDENYLLLEYLASNGYIVINSAFQIADGSGYEGGWFTGVGDYYESFSDINFIINYCRQNNISKSNQVMLSGHSYGANCAIAFIGEGAKNVIGLIPLDSDYGYALNNFFPKKYNPFVLEKMKFYDDLPMICFGRGDAHYRMLDSLSNSTRYFITIPNMTHNDFTAQGAIGKYYCCKYASNNTNLDISTLNYLRISQTILNFADSYTKKNKALGKAEINQGVGWQIEASNRGQKSSLNAPFDESKKTCPTISQYIDILKNSGMERMKVIYKECNDIDKKMNIVTDVFDYLYENEDSLKVITYLNWMAEIGEAEKNIYKIYFTVFYLSFLDTGNGFNYKKAMPIYNWLINKYPHRKEGYLGMAIYSLSTGAGDADYFCKKIIDVDPNYLNNKTNSFWDEHNREKIKNYMQRKN